MGSRITNIVFVFFVIFLCSSYADMGGKWYVNRENVAVRVQPDARGEVLARLGKGREVQALSREADWIWVEIPGEGITGWVHFSFLTSGGEPQKAMSAGVPEEYKIFRDQFVAFNREARERTGSAPFSRSEYIDEGIVNVTATESWMSSPEKGSVETLYDLWQASNEKVGKRELEVFINVVDSQGRILMAFP